ncbi:hypothetical protein E05_38600 [Plautia stali symbiont]|nr:hypothetical protein E05_38600 [Plautia stali symbiont]
MNFLAHLHLAPLADSLLLGNLLADFVRGNVEAQWPQPVVAGIALHRRIDVLTDNLPEVRSARQLFRAWPRWRSADGDLAALQQLRQAVCAANCPFFDRPWQLKQSKNGHTYVQGFSVLASMAETLRLG